MLEAFYHRTIRFFKVIVGNESVSDYWDRIMTRIFKGEDRGVIARSHASPQLLSGATWQSPVPNLVRQ